MRVIVAPAWAEAIFHVLAHIDAGPLAPSCFDRLYIAWVEQRLGNARERPLAEDARVLANAASSHDVLARVQALAWLFEDEADVLRAQEKELRELAEVDVRSPSALAIVRGSGPEAEVLRAAAELELPLLATLDALALDAAVLPALERLVAVAPRLEGCTVGITRPLGVRGRVLGSSIFVGAPGVAGADIEHIAWQAAHEATVIEVSATTRAFAEMERSAIALLRSRARAAGWEGAHATWLGRFDLRPLGEIPEL